MRSTNLAGSSATGARVVRDSAQPPGRQQRARLASRQAHAAGPVLPAQGQYVHQRAAPELYM